MKKFIILIYIVLLSGCASIMNDKVQSVEVVSQKGPTKFEVFNKEGIKVTEGVTPKNILLDKAGTGAFDPQEYKIKSDTNEVKLKPKVSNWVYGNSVFLFFAFVGASIDMISEKSWVFEDKVEI